MTKLFVRLTTLAAALALGACAVQPMPLPKADCVARVHSQYLSSLQDWQAQMAGAIAVEKPEWAAPAKQMGDTATLRYELERRRVGHVATYAPQRLAMDRGLHEVIEPRWGERDEADLRARDPEYARLADMVAARPAVAEAQDVANWLETRRDEPGAIGQLFGKQDQDAQHFEQRFGACRGT